MPAALLQDAPAPYSGDAQLTGFGPIDTVDFGGFQQANLNLGQNLNTLTINLEVPNLSVNTDQKVIIPSSGTLVDDSHNAGDDTIVIDQIGLSTLPGAADQINGGNGRDTVRVEIPGSPTDSTRPSSRTRWTGPQRRFVSRHPSV